MELTDAQVLAQLRLRKIKLTLELERVEVAIKAFEDFDVSDLTTLDLLAYDTHLVEETVEEDLKKDVMYSPEMHNEQKVLWALSKLKKATAIEISDYLMHQDAALKNRVRIINAITYIASRMYKGKRLDAEKIGTKNWYFLRKD